MAAVDYNGLILQCQSLAMLLNRVVPLESSDKTDELNLLSQNASYWHSKNNIKYNYGRWTGYHRNCLVAQTCGCLHVSCSIFNEQIAHKIGIWPSKISVILEGIILTFQKCLVRTVKPRYNELEGTVKSLVRNNRVRYNRILCKSAYVWVLYRMRIISIRDVFYFF